MCDEERAKLFLQNLAAGLRADFQFILNPEKSK